MEKSNRYIEKEKKNIQEKQMHHKANMHINLGLVVYFIIFAYLIFCVLNFSFAEKTNYTMAEPGAIVESEVFTGLIIKNEAVVNSDIEGTSNYFVPEGRKVKKGELVSCVDTTGELAQKIAQQKKEAKSKQLSVINFSANDNQFLQNKLKSYVLYKNNRSFEYTYNVKAEFEKAILDASNTLLLEDQKILDSVLATSGTNSKLFYAPKSGVVSYQFDGFETMNIESFTPQNLDAAITKKDALVDTVAVKGGPLFKIVDNYKWYLAAEINGVCAKYLEEKDYASIYIDYDNLKIQGKIKNVINEENKTYLILEFDRYLNEFLNERFLDFTIIYANNEGIKIPVSAITEKEFLKVPIESLVKVNQRMEVRKKVTSDKLVGGESLEGIPINIYRTDDRYAYIPKSENLNVGDTISYMLEDGQNMQFKIEEMMPIQGVFVLNKGYAAFKFIEVISYTEDYKIIKDATVYGINPYDRIATDAKTLTENQVIN